MTGLPDVVCLSPSQSLKRFDLPLLRYLSQLVVTAQWEYCLGDDEPSSMDTAVLLLHDYLKSRSQPVHLVGHGTGGLLGLMYSRQYPEMVNSLTLLSVGVHPAISWQYQYYFNHHFLLCSREVLLAQMAVNLFGHKDRHTVKGLVQLLQKDLDYSLSPHSPIEQKNLSPVHVPVPLFVCGSDDDFVISPNELQGWQAWLKEGDRLWSCPQGRHFFHYFHPQEVGRQMLSFWKSLPVNLFSNAGISEQVVSLQDRVRE